MSQKTREVGVQMADRFIGFVRGEGWEKEGKITVFSDNGIQSVDEEEYDKSWRKGRGSVLRGVGGERLWQLAEGWQGVREERINNKIRAKL